MVDVVEVTRDVCLDQVVVLSELQLDGEFVHSVEYSNAGAIPVATVQKVLLKDGFKDAFDRDLQQLVLGGRYSQWAQFAIPFRDVTPQDVLGPVAFPFQFFHQLVNVAVQVLLIFCRTHPVYATSGVFADVVPAIFEHFLVQQPEQVAKPVLWLFACLFRYCLQ